LSGTYPATARIGMTHAQTCVGLPSGTGGGSVQLWGMRRHDP